MEKLTSTELESIRNLAITLTGMKYDESHDHVFHSRLPKMARAFSYDNIHDLAKDLTQLNGQIKDLKKKNYFIDLITTHETSFFRDRIPFKILKDFILPEFKDKNYKGPIKFYSAACSSGQEPISLALTMIDATPKVSFPFSITASDISEFMIDRAKEGLYNQYEVQRGLPITMLTKHFKQQGDAWKLQPEVLSKINYQVENLQQPTFRAEKFDIIFCRNVTIYFKEDAVRKLYEHFHQILKPGGYFFAGGSESMTKHRDLFQFQKCKHGIYYQRID